MRRRLVLFLAVLVGVLAGMMFAPASASAATVNEVVFHCGLNAPQQVDPITTFGAGRSSAHLHSPAGADAFASDATVASMQAASTSCLVKSDHTMLWFPTVLKPGGTPATILANETVLTNVAGMTLDPLNPTPNGLRFIAGNSSCGLVSCAGNVIFQCTGSVATSHKIPTSCPAGNGFNEAVYAQNQCWDGASLGQGMGESNPPNVIGTNIDDTSTSCPSGFQNIPGIVWTIHVAQDGVGGYLTSDAVLGTQSSCPGCSGHFDFVFGQSPSMLSAVFAQCLDVLGWPNGPQATCREKANGDGTSSLWAVDPNTGKVTTLVSN